MCAYKRAFASALLAMTYASLRFADAQRLRAFDTNDDSIYGTLTSSKTKKAHGLNWPRACPRPVIAGATDWIEPIVLMRTAYRKINGSEMPYLFPRLDFSWQLVADGPSPYRTTRREEALLCAGLGGEKGESYTLRPRKNLFPTAANQMSFDQGGLSIIGHWLGSSKMPERYGRIV